MRFAHSIKKYLILAFVLFSLIALPSVFVEKLRCKFLKILSPFSKTLASLQQPFIKDETFKALEIENIYLRNALNTYLTKQQAGETIENAKGILGRVIYRDPMSWGSSCWIDLGEETNRKLGRKILQKNSPVLYGKSVIGVIDYVGATHSRVRLITDSGLKISVRAARGLAQYALIVEHVNVLVKALQSQKDLPINQQETAFVMQKLEKIKDHYKSHQKTWYLAKGLVQGSGAPLWRKKTTLKGSGFNYDFADAEGPARDLASGNPQDLSVHSPAMPLIRVNDLLVTTGMDGVFPPGLSVGVVTKIYPLKEGAYTYDIEAFPSAMHIDELKTVFVLPSLKFDLKQKE